MGQHRHFRLARVSNADQGGFPMPRLDSGCAAGSGSRSLSGPRATGWNEGHSGVAELLLQVADDRSRPVSRARPVYPVDEAEEYAALDDGRGFDHAPRAGVLRLAQIWDPEQDKLSGS